MNRAYWTGVASAFGLGCVVGGVAIRVMLEKKMRDEYDESFESLRATFDRASKLGAAETPAQSEEDLVAEKVRRPGMLPEAEMTETDETIMNRDDSGEIAVVGGEIDVVPDHLAKAVEVSNDYTKALSAVETSVEMFVAGGVNDYGVSYIEEEDFIEDDGRFKGKIELMIDDMNPVFTMDGDQISDWDERVGDSILVDFYRLVPPGAPPVLYVRNHSRDEDYEVTRVEP